MLAVKPKSLVSIVVPMFNEEMNVSPFLGNLIPVMDSTGYPYEVLLVDDGSHDQTWQHICAMAEKLPQLRGISLSRNFGHQSALIAGLHNARGDVVVSLDGDLQHPANVIPSLLEKWERGYKVVTTKRKDSSDTAWHKRAGSRIFYRVFSKLSGIEIHEGSSDFRLIDRCVLTHFTNIRDSELFLRGFARWLGFPSAQVEYQADERFAGESKYDFFSMLRLSSAAVISFSTIPLKLGIWLGFITSLIATAEIVYILFVYFTGGAIAGWASVMTFVSVMFSILFFMIGMIGLYIGSISEMLMRRPRFVVCETTEDHVSWRD